MKLSHTENSKDSTKKKKKLLKLSNKSSKVAGYEINILLYVAFPYTNSKLSEKEIKKTILFTIVLK